MRLPSSTLALGATLVLLTGCSAEMKAVAQLKVDTKTGVTAKVETSTKQEEPKPAAGIEAGLTGPHRSENNRARDQHRHPKETLEFFGLEPNMTVLEVEPGADAWYAEILAPALRDRGQLILTNFDPKGPEKSPLTKEALGLEQKLRTSPEVFDRVKVVTLTPSYALGEPNSVDMVLTFRTLHLWHMDKTEAKVFKAMFDVLKPGGVLGIEQHRAFPNEKAKDSARKGYMPQPYVIQQIEKAGFVFEAESHVNANSWDTKDYKRGVWTLPPVLALGDKDRAVYEKIGESDRMTLRFRKPKQTDDSPAVSTPPAGAAAPSTQAPKPAAPVSTTSQGIAVGEPHPSAPKGPVVAPVEAPLPAPAPKADPAQPAPTAPPSAPPKPGAVPPAAPAPVAPEQAESAPPAQPAPTAPPSAPSKPEVAPPSASPKTP